MHIFHHISTSLKFFLYLKNSDALRQNQNNYDILRQNQNNSDILF